MCYHLKKYININKDFGITSDFSVVCMYIYLFITFSPYKYISTEMKCSSSISIRKKEVKLSYK